jgi:Spy/CpxP family protein refolding chaperone
VSKVFMTRVLTGLLVGVLAATVAAADQQGSRPPQKEPAKDAQRGGPPGPDGGMQRFKWWQDPKVIAELRLAPDQSARIDEIWKTAFTRMNPVVDDLRKREEQLSNLIYGNDVTEAEVLKQAEQVEALRGTIGKSRILMLYRMRRVLSAEQRTKLANLLMPQDRDRRQGRAPDGVPGER